MNKKTEGIILIFILVVGVLTVFFNSDDEPDELSTSQSSIVETSVSETETIPETEPVHTQMQLQKQKPLPKISQNWLRKFFPKKQRNISQTKIIMSNIISAMKNFSISILKNTAVNFMTISVIRMNRNTKKVQVTL